MSFRSVLIATTVLAAWSAGAAAEVIKVGVTPGPHAQILEAVKPIAAKKGLDIQLIEFSCQSAFKFDPVSASNFGSDSLLMKFRRRLALVSQRNQHDAASPTSVGPGPSRV